MWISGLGEVVRDVDTGWYQSRPILVPVLGGAQCRMILDGYDDDPAPEDFDVAIRTFLGLAPSALTAAASPLFAYYRDVIDEAVASGDDDWHVELRGPDEIFDHIRIGDEPTVSRASGCGHVYVSLESECAWEPEHGLQIVFRGGHTVTKVGPYDGHLTNANAYADDTLHDVIYVSMQ